MENSTSQSSDNATRGEEWFLSQLELSPLPVGELTSFLISIRQEGQVDQADQWAELLCDTLIDRGEVEPALRVLKIRVSWHPATAELSATWKAIAQRALESDVERKSFVEHVGFGQLAPAECVRRLTLLLSLNPGMLCFDKTWGFGVVRRVDGFYARVEIDFEKKPQHALSLAYAAEVLQPIAEDHLLARLYREPEKMRELAKINPAEIVRICLRSYGPVTVQQLQTDAGAAAGRRCGLERFLGSGSTWVEERSSDSHSRQAHGTDSAS